MDGPTNPVDVQINPVDGSFKTVDVQTNPVDGQFKTVETVEIQWMGIQDSGNSG